MGLVSVCMYVGFCRNVSKAWFCKDSVYFSLLLAGLDLLNAA